MHQARLAAAVLAALSMPAFAVEIDGRIDPAEWQGAKHVTDFRLTQPLSRAPAPYPTEAWILATPEGLAIGFRNMQPASVPRNRQRGRRDAGGPVDRVNLMVDFDGDGRSGYNFTLTLADGITDAVIANENQFNDDWDGNWQHATSEDADSWSAEMLIPWHLATMQKAGGDVRTLGIQLDRVIGSTGERMAWPAVSFVEPRYLSALQKIEVPAYSQALLAITPYVSGVYDAVRGREGFDAGGDIFWKPSGQFQLTASVNPDFGQVESDDLVVNFGAIETFFSDKRPFFTENQGLFDIPFGTGPSRLLYTRRIGGVTDDGLGSGDVTAAVKLNGSIAGFNYGLLAATEADEVGRDFYALRTTRESDVHDFGAMLTHVRRPYLDREASVLSFDHRFTPNARWNVRTQVVGSHIEQAGRTISDTGFQFRADHDLGSNWRQQLYGVHLGADLQLNDIGYLERNNFNFLRYELGHRVTAFDTGSRYRGQDWRYAVSARHNDQGVHLAYAASLNRSAELVDGGNEVFEFAAFTPGHDDLILRGNGVLDVPEKFYAFYQRFRPRKGAWQLSGNARIAAEGLEGIKGAATSVFFKSRYYLNDSLSFSVGLFARRNPDWLLWRGGDLLGSFRETTAQVEAGVDWLIGDRQELRVKLQALGLDAQLQQTWRVGTGGTPVRSNDPVEDFSLRNLGFQIRYRYELAPLSALYIVYARGGSAFDPTSRGADTQLQESFDLRDDEQLLVKLAYRFEI